MIADPQHDEDELVQRIAADAADAADARALAAKWHGYAANGRSRTALAMRQGKEFDARLHEARASVRDAAAALLLSQSPADAAALMMQNCAAHHIKHPPLIGYDAAAVQYTLARTWQACAWGVDPSLPEVQPEWL